MPPPAHLALSGCEKSYSVLCEYGGAGQGAGRLLQPSCRNLAPMWKKIFRFRTFLVLSIVVFYYASLLYIRVNNYIYCS